MFSLIFFFYIAPIFFLSSKGQLFGSLHNAKIRSKAEIAIKSFITLDEIYHATQILNILNSTKYTCNCQALASKLFASNDNMDFYHAIDAAKSCQCDKLIREINSKSYIFTTLMSDLEVCKTTDYDTFYYYSRVYIWYT
jgi:ribosome-associated translation inhibitor RaiA